MQFEPGGGVGVLVDRAGSLVRAVLAVTSVAIAKEDLVNAVSVATLQLAVRADGLVGLEVGPGNPGLGQSVAIGDL